MVWQRLPSSQRQLILRQVGKHGPKAAAAAFGYWRARRRSV
jgi:hypothetical protein